MKSSSLTSTERRSAVSLASIFALRMLGLFMLLPVIRILGEDLEGATLPLLGLALGIYGLSQAILQLPLGVLSDKIGRKPVIYGGLLIFIAGSLVAGFSESIWGLIAGRALQGAGAIASAVMALAADLSRPQQRSKMMAMIGASIGLAFAISLILGPLLANWLSLQGLFFVIATLAFVALVVAMTLVPNGEQASKVSLNLSFAERWQHVTAKGRIFVLALAVFVIHWSLVAVFMIVPEKLEISGFELSQHSWIYLTVLVLSIALMVPMMLRAERKKKHRQIMQLAFFVIVLALASLFTGFTHIVFWLVVLTLFFAGFNLLEAKLPSTVSNLFGSQYRGTALGVFSTSQFLGAFLGGSLTGYLLPKLGVDGILYLNIGLAVIAGLALSALGKLPEIEKIVIQLSDTDEKSGQKAQISALKMPGVMEAVASGTEGKVYLQVDKSRINQKDLMALGQIEG
ncbi:MFS transporter [Kangiella sediminilitoris]|uniref:Major facilitator superfamily MFS_1 n=1 Tax=Kangiella sediminilitoris TaxID=1144748 RepID=A0A1B3B8S5_9GAMM|nr:MFS transporter [Kangiella sediminilitoris]AOE49202.1 Major facilitator superfamily MFS_1 [Kangiella sediminilitoris]